MKKIPEQVPRHLAIIMDGNRRWAKARGMSPMEGHSQGYDNLINIARLSLDRGVESLTVYVFSTENWQRSPEEVDFIMSLLRKGVTERLQEIVDLDVRLFWAGSRDKVAPELAQLIEDAVEKTKNATRGQLTLCFNYGGRQELVEAAQKAADLGVPITEDTFSSNLYTVGMPDVDLVVRTSGEQRLSNFLPWQVSYSEFYFTDVAWPDFDEIELDKALDEYTYRQRRHGK